jgi:hypothetical protein
MSSVTHATTHASTPGENDRLGRLVLFVTAPFLVFAYYTAVTVLKFVGRRHE